MDAEMEKLRNPRLHDLMGHIGKHRKLKDTAEALGVKATDMIHSFKTGAKPCGKASFGKALCKLKRLKYIRTKGSFKRNNQVVYLSDLGREYNQRYQHNVPLDVIRQEFNVVTKEWRMHLIQDETQKSIIKVLPDMEARPREFLRQNVADVPGYKVDRAIATLKSVGYLRYPQKGQVQLTSYWNPY